MKQPKLHFDADPGLHDGRPILVLLHGFTQNLHAWDGVRDGLRTIGPTVAVDLIGHGQSPKPDDLAHYRMPACMDQLEAICDRLGVTKAWWVGYSMGGRVALNLAVNLPQRIAGLVLVSTMAGINDLESRAERIRNDKALAERIPGWGMESFIDYWMGLPMFNTLKTLPILERRRIRAERLNNSPVGLANSLRGMGTGAMLPLWAHLPDITAPALVIAGELDQRFSILARSMADGLQAADLSIIPGAGHALHLESPQGFLRAITSFFQRQRLT